MCCAGGWRDLRDGKREQQSGLHLSHNSTRFIPGSVGYFHCVPVTIQFSCAILTCLVLLYVLLQSLPTNTPAFALFSKLKHITLKSIRDN